MAGVLPQQKLPKSKKDEAWWKENTDYLIEQSSFWSGDRWEMIMYYRAAMGIIDIANYKYVLNPYNSEEENYKNFPAQLRNYDIITPILKLFTGEKAERPLNHTVIVTNSDVTNNYKEALDGAFMANIAQGFVNSLNENGHNTGVPSKPIPDFDKLKEEYEVNWNDKRALFGQEAIDFLKYHLNLKDKYQEAFWDWLCVGRVYTFKDVFRDDVIHEIVPPIELWHGTTTTGFVEDANWACRKSRYSLNDVIDRFRSELTDEEVSELESKFRHGNEVVSTTFGVTPSIDKVVSSSTNNTAITPQGLIDVFHCCWKGFEQVGILKYNDPLLGEQEMEVDEDYKLDKLHGDISITWEWKNVVYSSYRIGQEKYKIMKELAVQRDELSNSSVCKLPYNGRIGYTERDRISSVVKNLMPYQCLYNIYHFRRELTLARNKDKIMLMPLGLIPDKWAPDKWMYMAESTGIGWFDETKPNAAPALNALKAIDMGLGNYIQHMSELLVAVKQEAWEAVGMNRQRYGDVKASDGKGNTDQAIVKSSVISREMFRRFERFQESDLQGLLDLSKVAWINGKQGMYINGEGRRAFLKTDPEQHLESCYQVFVTDADSELSKLEKSKQYAFGIAQKGGEKTSTVLEILDANNMSKLKNIVKKAEKIQQELEQANMQAEQAHEQHLEQIKGQSEDKANQTKIQVATINADAVRDSARIKSSVDLALDDNANNIPDVDELNTKYNDYLKSVREHDLQRQVEGLGAFNAAAERRLKEAKLELEERNIELKKQSMNKATKK